MALLSQEPKYKGIGLSQLMFDGMPEVNGGREDANIGIKAIGTKALPHFLSWLQAHDSSLKIKFMELFEEQSMFDFSFHSEDEYHMAALVGFEALGPIAKPAVPQLTKLLESPGVAERAAQALSFIGGEGDEILIRSLTNNNPVTRNAVALGLIQSNRKPGLPASMMMSCLRDSQPNVRAFAAECIATTPGDPGIRSDIAVPILLQELQSTNSWNGMAAVAALGKFPDHQEIIAPELMKCLPQAQLRTEAVESLQKLHVNQGLLISNLVEQAHNGSQDTRRWATLMLGGFKEDSSVVVPELIKMMQNGELRQEGMFALRRIGAAPEVMLPYLLEDLNQPRPDLRMRAVRMLASFGKVSEPAVPMILKLAEEQPDNGQKLYFLESALKIEPSAVEEKVKLLDHDYHDPGSSLPELTSALAETNNLVRRMAVFRMGTMGAGAKAMVPTLQGLMEDQDQRLRFEARMALRKIDPDSAPAFGNQMGFASPRQPGRARRR